MELSKQQQEAVEHIGPALVVAGAGSGKTRALTAKIAHLIEQGYAPERILAITFTNKAADEMKRRLVSLTGYGLDRFPWVRTFHSACLRILKTHCQLLGFHPPLQILGEYQQQKLVQDILREYNVDKKHTYPVRSYLSYAKNSGSPLQYLDNNKRLRELPISEIYHRYEKELKTRNAVDFDNLLLLSRDLLRDYPEVRGQYQRLFSYILVDEYQDTNDLQEELTRLLLGNGNLFCVGDDWQAIYGFRGSNVNNFLAFSRNYTQSRIFRLEQNYRSASEIVETANSLIAHNPRKMEKACYSRKQGGTVETLDFFSDEEEARWVAEKMHILHQQGLQWSQMAVLYRTKFCSLPFEQAFRSLDVPYQLLGGKGFYERKEILDITCYLTAAAFDKDDTAFERILNVPRRGIGPSMVNRMAEYRKPGTSLKAAARAAVEAQALSAKAGRELHSLLALLDAIAAMPPAEAVNRVLEATGYLEHLRQYARTSEDYTSREENIEQLIYSASRHGSLLEYLEEAALVKEDKEGEQTQHRVSMATMHASKGLEFEAVFVAGCEENLLPHWKSRETLAAIEEERRLLYVAMTRAERFLYLSSAEYRKGQFNPRSRFLEEIVS
ncbi:MAG TPA: UvrD-helicase domain-containing protein [Desulfosalsimonadaceae bacterium]|nr:UvrD-helicase domain-containing protein [Desulfosalsimonadaceae bacterium]